MERRGNLWRRRRDATPGESGVSGVPGRNHVASRALRAFPRLPTLVDRDFFSCASGERILRAWIASSRPPRGIQQCRSRSDAVAVQQCQYGSDESAEMDVRAIFSLRWRPHAGVRSTPHALFRVGASSRIRLLGRSMPRLRVIRLGAVCRAA
ncbi:hypothetical protein BC834DRAFT_502093 [Gloeopeniophorella convolvens]|nr:hypothetical protein BC834DRAFT_502093 [Gloeopeniophorella convolvens]